MLVFSNFFIHRTLTSLQVWKVVRLHVSLPENGAMLRNRYQRIRQRLCSLKEISGAEPCLLFPVLLILAAMKVLDHSCLVLSSYLTITLML